LSEELILGKIQPTVSMTGLMTGKIGEIREPALYR
jgi:hypothetical protein